MIAPRGGRRTAGGFSLVELLIVLAITVILTAVAIPQMLAQRRLYRSVAVTSEIMGLMRSARQSAMSQRRAYTLQYDDSTKEIKIIGPIPPGTAGLTGGGYPNNVGSSVTSHPLAQGGLKAGEISYGIPTTSTGLPPGSPLIPTGALDDGATQTSLTSSKVNVTFQPDGSVIDVSGFPSDKALFIFNNQAALGTASAISILGTSGRVKVWRYSASANKYKE